MKLQWQWLPIRKKTHIYVCGQYHIELNERNNVSTNISNHTLSSLDTARSFPHSSLNTGFVTRLTRRVPLVEQELLTLPEHLSSSPVLSGVRVTRSLFVPFSFLCWPLCCLSFFDLQILITSFASSNSSY